MKVFRCSSPCVQIMKISSMNLHQMDGLSEELSEEMKHASDTPDTYLLIAYLSLSRIFI